MYYIYKLFFEDYNDCYIGQTQNFHVRLQNHKTSCNSRPTYKIYKFINSVGWDKVKYQILETVDEESRLQAKKRERFYIDLLKPSLNKIIPLRDGKTYFEDNKQEIYFKRNIANKGRREEQKRKSLEWYHLNKDKIKEQRNEYYKKNCNKISKLNKIQLGCLCGLKMNYSSKYDHIKSKKHHNNSLIEIQEAKQKLKYSNKNIDIRL